MIPTHPDPESRAPRFLPASTSRFVRLAIAALWLPVMAWAGPGHTQSDTCEAKHRLVITEARIVREPGDVAGLSGALTGRLVGRLEAGGFNVEAVVAPTRAEGLTPAMDAFARHAAPYFLRLEAVDLVTEGRPSAFVLLPARYAPRAGELVATLDEGARGIRLGNWRINLEATSGRPFDPPVDARGRAFWQSDWGRSLDAGIERLATAINATLDCRPLTGRVVSTQARGGATDLRVDLGREDGLGAGDRILVVDPGTPIDWLGVNLLTRPALETTAGPVRDPRSLGEARLTYLGERESTLRYLGTQPVEAGDLIEVTPRRDRLEPSPE
ncbi:MAG: hypothetical protein JXJ30_09150 [Halothiobacillaceae bacterium]|nr:hypothetical protein [Halothiobacillaceae bacterium]HER35416.1 hypothetical protein [Halothiobacillaceae bacterium]